jgi:4-hydroxy-3-polyprenylbenzoate decarboxylase
MKVVVAITGASGAVYGITLVDVLHTTLTDKPFLIVSENGKKLIEVETDCKLKDLKSKAVYYEDHQLEAPLSSGSFLFDAMVIVPCSLSTLSKIASGIADTLITRCACVALKENRSLIIVPRETPLSTIHLQNMAALSTQGVTVLPAMPAFYCNPHSIGDIVSFVVGKILDQLGVQHQLYERWNHAESLSESL